MAQGSSLGPHSFHLMFHVSSGVSVWSFQRPHFPLLPHHLLPYHPVLLSARHLHLAGCGGQIPCALPPMRTLAPLPSTTLSQVMSPTTTTSRRLMNTAPRNPRSSSGPRMISTTMTSPSARRSLMRAEEEPITLKKVGRPVCRRPSVMKERETRCETIWLVSFERSRNSETQLRK